jgi:hypothetical protein
MTTHFTKRGQDPEYFLKKFYGYVCCPGFIYRGNAPSLMSMQLPLIYAGLSVANQSIVFAISTGVANLPECTLLRKFCFLISGIFFIISVSTGLAAIALTTIPYCPSCLA